MKQQDCATVSAQCFIYQKGIDNAAIGYKYYRVKTLNEAEKNYLGNVYRIELKSEAAKKQASMLNQLLLFVFAIGCLAGHGQTDRGSVLYATILEKDSLLFAGFNNCDIALLQEHVSEHFEFYHDQVGITNSKEAFIAGIENNICKLPYRPKRVLDDANEVYGLEKDGVLYGAIQVGKHHFYAIESNTEYLTSTAQFTHVWIIENGEYKLSRGLSFDHQDFEKPIDEELLFIDKTETERWLKQKSIPALGIGVIQDGKLMQTAVFGELHAGKPAPLNTIWNVASLTKPITALVALKLVDAGKWDLDEPLDKYYTDPDVAADIRSKIITTRMVLSHQTGLPNWRGNNADGKLSFEFEPGTQYQYSGEGYEYLRKALEQKFKKSLEELAKQLIFKPLKMKDTHFKWNKNVDASRFAKWHSAEGELYAVEMSTNINAADNLLTTVEDYSKFVAHIVNGAGLSESLYNEMTADQVRINEYKHFGLGWWVDENINNQNDFALVHGGDDIGVHTIAFMVPKTKKGLIIFTNSDNGTDAFVDVLLHFFGTDGEGIMNVEMK